MKFRCEREILATALATAGRGATNSTGTSPVLSGVRLDVVDDTLTITGTDLELTIKASVPVGMEQPGSTVIPARLTADIVKALPAGSVDVEFTGDNVSISAQRSQFAVRPMAVNDFPLIVAPSNEPFVLSGSTMSAATLFVAIIDPLVFLCNRIISLEQLFLIIKSSGKSIKKYLPFINFWHFKTASPVPFGLD